MRAASPSDPREPTGASDADARDVRISECLREYHDQHAAGAQLDATYFREKLGEEDFAFLQRLLATDGLLESPDPSMHDGALPRTFGNYTLLRELGKGTTGIVYEAVERGRRRSVAVKILRDDFDDDVARERFLREASACAQIEHEGIVQVLDSGEAEGHPFFAMTYVEGRPLSKCLGARDQTIEDICTRAAGVADALAQLHRNGIVHRDVKPGNILVRRDGRWLLADFGHVHNDAAATLTRSGDALGTPLYMAPEQARGVKGVDGRADVYGLGATLYHVLTGTPVFQATEIEGLMRAVLMDRAESMLRRAEHVPANLDRVVLKCLEKRPEDRYEDADALARDLRAVAAGTATRGRPVGRVGRALRLVAAHPLRAAAGFLVAVGVTAALLWPRTPTLEIETFEGASITVAGTDGTWTAPLTGPIPLEIGENAFTVSRDGFHPRTMPFQAKSGGHYRYARFALAPKDPHDIATQQMLLTFLGVLQASAPELRDEPRHRGGERTTTVAVYPRGKITVTELDEYLVSTNDELEGATLVWSKGNEKLASGPFDPNRNVEAGAIPQEVRDALRPGDTLSWALVDGKKTIAKAQATIVAASADDLDDLNEGLGDLKLDADALKGLRVRAWIERGFATRALREIGAATNTKSHAIALLRLHALKTLCGDDKVLRASEVWTKANGNAHDLAKTR